MNSHPKNILAIHYGHDSTVALIQDGVLVEAMSEERLSRFKKYSGFPHLSLEYIKSKYGLTGIDDVYLSTRENLGYMLLTNKDNEAIRKSKRHTQKFFTAAVISRYPLLNALRDWRRSWLRFYGRHMEQRSGMEAHRLLAATFPNANLHFIDHHQAHAWTSVIFFPKDERRRLIFTLDGEGDSLSGSINLFEQGQLIVKETFPDTNSLGYLYGSVVELLGMTRNEHEFKVMGLAPYAKKEAGERVYEELSELLWFNEEKMMIETKYDMRGAVSHLIARDFGARHRFDSLAYGIQKLTEEIIVKMVRAAIKKYDCHDIAISGGVFMNVKANQCLAEMPEVNSLVVTPSCGDESLAIGAAVYGYWKEHQGDLTGLKGVKNLYLGSEYSDEEIGETLKAYPASSKWTVTFVDPEGESPIEHKVAGLLAQNAVVGRFKGRAEWGARALGNRSILANPSSRDNVKLINEMIKGRDFWMPFATSLLHERREDYLKRATDQEAPYMAITFNTKPLAHKELPAALHPYDLTSRPQIVSREMNPDYHQLISEFERLTGIGGVLNTSFNLHGEPNVEQPVDALRTFELSGLPHLAIGNYLISKPSL
jgi:carbamoyltransferase